MSMSILNYFGKVNSQYKKYNCEEFRHSNNINRYKRVFCFRNEKTNTKRIIVWALGSDGGIKELAFNITDYPISNPLNIIESQTTNSIEDSIEIQDTYCSYLSPELYIFSFTNLFDTFSKCIEQVREKLYSKIWNTIECCPLINIIDLLILKQSDTDKHIEHIEQMFQSLIDDNKLLQNKINVLEKHLLKPIKEIKIAHAVEYKTVGEEIFYDTETESLSEL